MQQITIKQINKKKTIMETEKNSCFIYKDKTYTLEHLFGAEYVLTNKKTGSPNFIIIYENNKIAYENWMPTDRYHDLFLKKIIKHKNKSKNAI